MRDLHFIQELMFHLMEAPAKDIRTLSQTMGADSETVISAIESLRHDWGCQIAHSGGKYVLTNTGNFPVSETPFSVELKPADVIALFFLKERSSSLKGTKLDELSGQALQKISRHVPGVFRQLEKIKSLFVSIKRGSKNYGHRENEIFTKLMRAMLMQKKCKISYHSFSSEKVSEYSIAPLNFFEYNEGTYVFVKIDGRDNIMTLALERIQSVDITEETYKRPEGFDPESYLELAFGIVDDEPFVLKVHVARKQARYVRERIWGQGQKITENPDGSIVIEFKTSGWMDVKRWVLSFGEEMRVLEPERMGKDIVDTMQKALDSYGQA
ncbi:putative DNA-binding transcriptional regulator YafY [Desulfobotulus alkaliphilus]|uniref:Putative DNA-binding transcriptional regulator YafY n=1 Tax=Desulfobotulus alkaliphilus TaxID=622671 RepID=A0A562R4U5_9BACT|nr:WYL domain-containing protein [Desulfobotulus alkaliphilus]TWI63406.1 putative DNA-binding transcriptional regulator YafY [Desulfobotulus alkaliphilus]